MGFNLIDTIKGAIAGAVPVTDANGDKISTDEVKEHMDSSFEYTGNQIEETVDAATDTLAGAVPVTDANGNQLSTDEVKEHVGASFEYTGDQVEQSVSTAIDELDKAEKAVTKTVEDGAKAINDEFAGNEHTGSSREELGLS